MKKSTLLSILTIVVLIPATLYLGTQLTGRWYYLTSTLVIIETMLPFFFSFEARKPQARELVTIAVMAAIAAASRAVFAFLPTFKPITAIIMITGIAFGPQAGFLTGSLAAFVSNFMFGQGPWTPWQMMAYGFGGFLAGVVFHRRKMTPKPLHNAIIRAVFGFFAIVLVVGPLLDSCTIFTTGSKISWSFVLTVLASGLPVNLSHGTACALTMLLFSNPLLEKLERIQVKYGMMEGDGNGV